MNKNKLDLVRRYIKIALKGTRLSNKMFAISLQDKATTLLQMSALQYLKDHPGATVGELANELVMSSPAIAQMTDRLVKTGWVKKEIDQKDRRITHLVLTAIGEKEINAIPNELKEKIDEVFSYISEEDLETVVKILTKFVHNIEERNIQ
ncbi:MAG TPA: MarR family winged helix-turn-helix transcriptional regulator [Patescibacteria group bacterium]|nr:MarR family winged helix-turn-helix transcriptional regulator [Patescibacteria group bacterium]